jgi:hypothetical protein
MARIGWRYIGVGCVANAEPVHLANDVTQVEIVFVLYWPGILEAHCLCRVFRLLSGGISPVVAIVGVLRWVTIAIEELTT